MKFDNFEITASPFIHHAYCKCGKSLIQVANGFISKAMYCPKCENVYVLKLIKVPYKKIKEEFIAQCRRKAKKVQTSDS